MAPAGTFTQQSTIEEGRPLRRSGGPEPQPAHLFRLLECEEPAALPARSCLRGLAAVAIGRRSDRGGEVSEVEGLRRLSLTVPDRWMSSEHAQLRRTAEGWLLEDSGSKNGTFVDGRRVEQHLLADGELIEVGHTFFRFRAALEAPAAAAAHFEASAAGSPPGLATLLPAFEAEVVRLRAVAPSRLPIVLRGESGTGKEVVANAVHLLSARPGPFQAVNCGALSEAILESELFGYRKGAFSGALEDRPGLVRASDRGTLFLDEIGELPPAAQAALLRVLQESEVTPVGGTKAVKVDLRLVVATHRDLEAMAAEGKFRPDLLARLAGFTLRLPPLRERREDLGLFIAALLRRHATRLEQVTFRPEAARLLLSCSWPLNVRELEKALAAAILLASGKPIDVEHLPPSVREGKPPLSGPSTPPGLREEDHQRRERILALVAQHHGNLTAVARDLGKARTQLQRWIKRYAIDLTRYRR